EGIDDDAEERTVGSQVCPSSYARADRSGNVTVRTVAKDREYCRFDFRVTGSCHVAFSPDGSTLVVDAPDRTTTHLLNLRAIGTQLTELNLDWDAPPLPPPPEWTLTAEPLDIRIDLGK